VLPPGEVEVVLSSSDEQLDAIADPVARTA